jgi:hypothetical protein
MRLKERLLYGVLGILCAAEEASRGGEHTRALAADESRECLFVSAAQAFDERVGCFSRCFLARGPVEELGDVAGASLERRAACSKGLQQRHARKIDERHAAQIERERRGRGEAPVGQSSELVDRVARYPPLDEEAGLGFGFQLGYSQHALPLLRGPCQGSLHNVRY